MNPIIPIPKIPISVRVATLDDLPFIDALQKKHTKQVGWMPTKQLEGKINAGHVIVAETVRRGTPPHPSPSTARSPGTTQEGEGARLAPTPSSLNPEPRTLNPVGYLIGHDQYFKRDDVGIIYQINIAEGKRRGFIGAALLKAQFERSAYGCRLYCCWCAQDIEANHFWEAMGFVPLAFRTGSRAKGPKGTARVHIFWQRRIRQGDVTTPYWFPAQTSSGSIREDRLVLPIPPGVRWSDEMPRVLPEEKLPVVSCQLPEKKESRKRSLLTTAPASGFPRPLATLPSPYAISRSKLRFAAATPVNAPKEKPPRACPEQGRREKRKVSKNDPKLVAAARELRDRWLERVNEDPSALIGQGKYDVSRVLTDGRERSDARTTSKIPKIPTMQIVHTIPILPAPCAPMESPVHGEALDQAA